MKKTLILLALTSSLVLSAQDEISGIDVSISIGFTGNIPIQLSLADYRTMVPQSAILQRDYSSFSSGYNASGYQFNTNTLLNVLWGFKLKDNTNYEQRLRIGFTYSGLSSHSTNASKATVMPYDTLISQRTGNEYYLDSTFFQGINAYNAQEAFALDVSYIIRSNPAGRLSFYAGMGILAGALVNSKIHIDYYEGSNSYGFRNYPGGSNTLNESERYNLNPGFIGQIYMPLGFNFRLSGTNEFFKRMHLYTELRPGVQYLRLPDVGGNTQLSFGMAVLGLRHEF